MRGKDILLIHEVSLKTAREVFNEGGTEKDWYERVVKKYLCGKN